MTSILTNGAALSSLRALADTQRGLDAVQKQVSTGLRVGDASDAPAYWSIGVSMRSRIGALSAVQDALALTGSITDVTAAALDSVIAIARKIEANVVTAAQPGVDAAAVQRSIAGQQASILSVVRSASFGGVNWLMSDRPFAVTDHLLSTDDHSASSADAATIDSGQTASKDLGDRVHDTDEDVISVSGANGYSNTITSHYDRSYTLTKAAGSSSFALSDDAETFTVDPGTPLAAARIDAGPASYTDAGLLQLGASDLSIVDSGYGIQSSWDYGQSYSDTASQNRYTSTGQRFFFSAETDAAFAASVPGALLGPLLALDVTGGASSESDLRVVTAALDGLTAKAAALGSLQTAVAAQSRFNASLSDALASGLGALVDADMNVASTRLQALQIQRQLGIQALSIANKDVQSVLKLFAAS